MNRVLLNTLYIMHPEGYLRLDNQTIRYERDKETVARIPAHHISAIVVRANILLSPSLLKFCSEKGIQVTWLSWSGRFVGGLRSPTQGNVLLRLSQFEAYRERPLSLKIASQIVWGKIRNARHTLARKARDLPQPRRTNVEMRKQELDRLLKSFPLFEDHNALRGYEGQAARVYFSAFGDLLSTLGDTFAFEKRSKRPPRDPINALMSFAYTIATHDCNAALEGVGLDPQIGFLHEIRPGRPALALDLVEEFRASFVDRLIFALLNRRQLSEDSFEFCSGGAVRLNEEGRAVFLDAYQRRKEDLIPHPKFREPLPFGVIPHIQARLLARCLRGDLDTYEPFEYR